MSKIIFTFGRFNPPTKGHLSMIEQMKKMSTELGCPYKVYTSQKQDNKKNPINYRNKIKFIESILGTNISQPNNIVSIFDVINDLSDMGYDDLIMVVGSDRKKIFEKKLLQYVGTEFDIKSLKIVSVNRTNNNTMDVNDISSSQMRDLAKNNNFKDFCVGLPENIHITDSKQLFKEVQRGLMNGRKDTPRMV